MKSRYDMDSALCCVLRAELKPFRSLQQILSGLKALGNMGFMKTEVRNNINECIKDNSVPVAVRLAAIEASRNSPCNKQTKETLLNILEDKKEDNEVRIAAYLAIMRCPCSPAISRIQNLLEIEEFNQGINSPHCIYAHP